MLALYSKALACRSEHRAWSFVLCTWSPSERAFTKNKAQRTKHKSYGKEIIDCESCTQTEVLGAGLHSLQTLWTAARLLAEVQFVPHLFSRVGAPGTDPWRG